MFNPESEKNTKATVWVRLPYLHFEYLEEETLFRIARGLGKPVYVDHRTLRVEYGYFAAVLVDIDFSKPLPNLVIDDEDCPEGFRLDYDFMNRPEFCDHCKSVGHTFSQCRSAKYKDLEKLHDAEEDPLKRATIKAEMDELKDYWKKEKFKKPKKTPPPPPENNGKISISHALPETTSSNLAAGSMPLCETDDNAATITLDLEREEEELYKFYDEQKKIVDDMAKAADLAKIEQDALLAKLQNTR
ncbi:uncharacterized protein LOC113305835 [Papaver somniferum]|uniref:uncharacterized protein LOC113305835 n=1 Tax=Papaver somniferum TaxID=3469 RepID=UPI000E6FF01F|nr:uncharacterized protein LOC113305835 [Papaver somniferum]